jgi:hypothetical protein
VLGLSYLGGPTPAEHAIFTPWKTLATLYSLEQ